MIQKACAYIENVRMSFSTIRLWIFYLKNSIFKVVEFNVRLESSLSCSQCKHELSESLSITIIANAHFYILFPKLPSMNYEAMSYLLILVT